MAHPAGVCADDNSLRTVHGAVRVPTVIVLSNYANVPNERPKFSANNIWQRDDATCQYTGRKLLPHEGNIDRVVPAPAAARRHGRTASLAHREINSRKADRLPEEVTVRLRRLPAAPLELPATILIRNAYLRAVLGVFLEVVRHLTAIFPHAAERPRDLDDMARGIGLPELTKPRDPFLSAFGSPDQQAEENSPRSPASTPMRQNPVCGTAHNVACPEMLHTFVVTLNDSRSSGLQPRRADSAFLTGSPCG